MFVPVEYLTYEIRDISDHMRLVGVDAHIDPLLLADNLLRGDESKEEEPPLPWSF